MAKYFNNIMNGFSYYIYDKRFTKMTDNNFHYTNDDLGLVYGNYGGQNYPNNFARPPTDPLDLIYFIHDIEIKYGNKKFNTLVANKRLAHNLVTLNTKSTIIKYIALTTTFILPYVFMFYGNPKPTTSSDKLYKPFDDYSKLLEYYYNDKITYEYLNDYYIDIYNDIKTIMQL